MAALEGRGYCVWIPEGVSAESISSGNDFALSSQLILLQFEQAKATLNEFLRAPQVPIISSELLSEITIEGWQMFRQIALELEVEVTLVVYLRNVLPYFTSAYDQVVKRHGESREFASWYPTYDSVYAKIIKMVGVLGTDVIRAIHYDSNRGDVITPFLSILGLDASAFDAEPFQTKVINRSLSNQERDLLREVNRLSGDHLSEVLSDAFLKKWPAAATHRAEVSSEIEHDFIMRFQGQVDAINRKLFHGDNILKVVDRRGARTSSDSRPVTPVTPVGDTMTREGILEVALEAVVKKHVSQLQSIDGIRKAAFLEFRHRLVDAARYRDNRMVRGLPDDFNPIEYGLLNPDVIMHEQDPFHHYLHHGKAEGRIYRIDQLSKNS